MHVKTIESKSPLAAPMSLARAYYMLAKPGIIYGNLLSVAAGFFLASARSLVIGRLLAVLAGSALVMAAGCVINNYIDRNLDRKMKRTQSRALAIGSISVTNALVYAALLAAVGFVVLARYTNWLTIGVGAVGFIDYVVFYAFAKRYSVHGTLVGSISGAMPILAGYVSVSGQLDAGALIVFLILTAWQMPHFYAISMYRRSDYKAAGLPVLSVARGIRAAKLQILLYIVLFTVAVSLLTFTGYTGVSYLVIMLALSLWWLTKGLRSYQTLSDKKWGRSMFKTSLIVLMVTSLMLAIGPRLP